MNTNLRANFAMAWPLKLIVFVVNHWRDILNCSCKWLCFFVITAHHNEQLTCIGEMWHIVISAAALFDNEVSDAFPVACCLRVTIEVEQLLVFLTVTVWWRQVGLLQYPHSTDEWLRVPTQTQPVNASHNLIGYFCILPSHL